MGLERMLMRRRARSGGETWLARIVNASGIAWQAVYFKDQQGRTLVRDLDGHHLTGGAKKAWKVLDDKGRVIGALDEALNFIPLK